MPSVEPVCADADFSGNRARSGSHLRVLTFSSLFPSPVRPRHGIFVETRLGQLLRDCPVDARVIAPVPWFPFRNPSFGAYALFASTPQHGLRDNGVHVSYPRYLMVPRLGVSWQPDGMARAAMSDLTQWLRSGWRPELIDAHYLYPDGVAASILAQRLNLPFVMTARGTDVNVIAGQAGPGRRILGAARQAAAVITVSKQLKEILIARGVDAGKIVVLRNGVDLEVFKPEDQAVARRHLGLAATGRLAVSVGNLVPEKGQALAIEALVHLAAFRLAIVGNGPLRDELATLARRLGVGDRVQFLPAMPQSELRHLYASADVLLLTSSREGWPNVVLESLACGTPVVGFDVGAVKEMLTDKHVGRIVAARNPAALSAAVLDLERTVGDSEHIRRHAAQFDWQSVSRGQWDVFMRATDRFAPCRPRAHD